MEKYTTSSFIQQTTSEGTSFAQRVGDSNKQIPLYDKNIGKIFNASDSYIKVTQHHISQRQLPILTVVNKVTMKNISRANQVSQAKLIRQKVILSFAIFGLK